MRRLADSSVTSADRVCVSCYGPGGRREQPDDVSEQSHEKNIAKKGEHRHNTQLRIFCARHYCQDAGALTELATVLLVFAHFMQADRPSKREPPISQRLLRPLQIKYTHVFGCKGARS